MSSKIKFVIIGNDAALMGPFASQVRAIENYEVCAEVKTVEALDEACKSSSPDIFILDLSFEGEEFFEYFKTIESQIASGKVAVIAVSGSSDINKLKKAMKVGCSDFLTLPIKAEELAASLNSAFEKIMQVRKATVQVALPTIRKVHGKVLTIFSTKGGVGKSTLATNLAVMLALTLKNKGRRVALVDANFQFGDIALMLNLKPNKTIYELVMEMGAPAQVSLDVMANFLTKHESGLEVLLAPAKPQFAEEITMLHLRYIMECLKKNFDYVVVDTTSHITETELTIFDWTSKLFMISTLEITTIKNLVITMETLKDLQFPKENIFLLLNRAFQKMGIEETTVENKLTNISCHIPSDGDRVVPSLNNGSPFVMSMDMNVPIVKAFYDLVYFVTEDEDKKLLKPEEFAAAAAAKQGSGNVLDFFKKFMK